MGYKIWCQVSKFDVKLTIVVENSKLLQVHDFLFDRMGSGRVGSDGNQKCHSILFIVCAYIDYVYVQL